MSVRICILDNAYISSEDIEVSAFGDAERSRLLGIKNESRRRESGAGLMALLAALDGREPSDIYRDGNGRPHFEGNVGVDFNISHSGVLSAAAVVCGAECRVGLDIELVDSARDASLVKIADRYFTEKEKKLLGETGRIEDFYKIWTAKEARAKLIGAGLSHMLSDNYLCENEDDERYCFSHFAVMHGGKRYILTLCTYRKEEITFICGDGIIAEPLIAGNAK